MNTGEPNKTQLLDSCLFVCIRGECLLESLREL
jgi:hypothetical protein